jgi:hypothetical protein
MTGEMKRVRAAAMLFDGRYKLCVRDHDFPHKSVLTTDWLHVTI